MHIYMYMCMYMYTYIQISIYVLFGYITKILKDFKSNNFYFIPILHSNQDILELYFNKKDYNYDTVSKFVYTAITDNAIQIINNGNNVKQLLK